MSKEEYLEMLYQKLNIPRQLLIKYIHSVGTNEENIKDYAMNTSCAVVRKDNGFQIDYTAEMINNKDQKIDQLKQQLAEKEKENEELKQQNIALENENSKLATELIVDKYQKAQKRVSFGIQFAIAELEKVKELLLDEYKKYPIVYDKTNDIVAGALDRDKVNEIIDQQIKLLKGEKDNG